MALAHHDAAFDDQRRCRKAVLFGAQQGRDDDISSGFHLAVRFDANAPRKSLRTSLVRFRKTQLPGNPPYLIEDSGEARFRRNHR